MKQAGEVRSARVESIRALTALSVVVVHVLLIAVAAAPPMTFTNRVLYMAIVAVNLFFVMSGYFMYLPFVRAGRVNVKRYLFNRAVRVLPPYYAAVAILYAVQPSGAEGEDWWRFALFLQNTSLDTFQRLDGVMWTLVLDVQFYLLLPVLAFGIRAIAGGSLGRAAAVVGALALASFALRLDRVLLNDTYATDPFGRFSIVTLFFYFAGGMLLALLKVHLDRSGGRLPGSSTPWLLAAIAIGAIGLADFEYEPAAFAACVIAFGACVLPLKREGGLARLLDWKPLAALGVASYSLYLWHGPILLWVAGQTALANPNGGVLLSDGPQDFKLLLVKTLLVSIPVAAVSYWLLERPFLRMRRRWGPSTPAIEPKAERRAERARAEAPAPV